MKSIDYNGYNYSPFNLHFSYYNPVDGFRGVFDGNNKTFRNFTHTYQGTIVGDMYEDAVLKNLTVENSQAIDGKLSGSIFAYTLNDNARIENCTYNGDISLGISLSSRDSSRYGGFVQRINGNGEIVNCVVNGEITYIYADDYK